MRRANRVDANHGDVIQTLRACGWHVHDTSALGNGFPDCVAAKHGRIVLIEIKDGSLPQSRRKLTSAEQRVYQQLWLKDVEVEIVESIEQAARLTP